MSRLPLVTSMDDREDDNEVEQEPQEEEEAQDVEAEVEAEGEQVEPAELIVQLAAVVISAHLSLLSRTSTGLEHAFTKLEIHQQAFTHTKNLASFPHLRFIVTPT